MFEIDPWARGRIGQEGAPRRLDWFGGEFSLLGILSDPGLI